MSELKLYSARACPFAHRSRLVLAEKKLKFELVEIDLANKPAWFSGVSLYGKVPALEHDGRRIVESAIVNEYLDEVFPEPPLLPSDAVSRALARIWIDFANTRLAAAFTKVLWSATDADRQAGRGELVAALERIEKEALGELSGAGPYWFGAAPTLVDFAFYPWFERLPAFQEHTGFGLPGGLERLARWRDAVSQRESVREIANPASFYLERYRSFRRAAASPPAQPKAS